jgi:hypothetical protein
VITHTATSCGPNCRNEAVCFLVRPAAREAAKQQSSLQGPAWKGVDAVGRRGSAGITPPSHMEDWALAALE